MDTLSQWQAWLLQHRQRFIGGHIKQRVSGEGHRAGIITDLKIMNGLLVVNVKWALQRREGEVIDAVAEDKPFMYDLIGYQPFSPPCDEPDGIVSLSRIFCKVTLTPRKEFLNVG